MIINPIVTGSGGYVSRKYNVTISSVLKSADSGGYYYYGNAPYSFVGTGIKHITNATKCAFAGKFLNMSATPISFSLPDVEDIQCESCFQYAFQNSNIQTFDVPKLKKLKSAAVGNFMFSGCGYLTTLQLPELMYFQGANGWMYACYSCYNLTTVFIPKLFMLDNMNVMFGYDYSIRNINLNNITYMIMPYNFLTYNTGITKISFPMAQHITGTSTSCFTGCTNLKIHFRTDMQSVVSALSGYASGFGTGSSSNVIFDLVGKIQKSGESDYYQRNEYYSKYSGTTQQRIGWSKTSIVVNGTTYYRDATKDTQTYYSQQGTAVYPDMALGWTSTGNITRYTSVMETPAPAIGTNVYSDTNLRTSAGTVATLNHDVVYTVAGSEPIVGSNITDENGTILGTVGGVA